MIMTFYYLAQKAFSPKDQQVPLSNQYETEANYQRIQLISYSINRLPVVLRFLPIGTFIALFKSSQKN